MKELHLHILSPEKTIFDGTVTRVILPGKMGNFTILVNHAPIVSSLEKGEIKYVHEQKEYTLQIEEGFIELKDNIIQVCMS
ncbi:MAG: hypothetical protein WCS34_06005 [Bacteroidales bacterium]